MQVTVLHHSDAGEGEWPAGRVKAELAAVGIDARYCSAADSAARDIIAEASGTVLVIGGDGTVAKAATWLDRMRARLAILPTGGANNIAHSLGVYAPPDAVLRGLASPATVALHIGEMRLPDESIRFVEAAGIGILTRSMQASIRGLPRSFKQPVGRQALRQALLDAPICRAAVTLDGVPAAEPALAFEFMNISRIGPGLQLASPREADGMMAAVWLPAEARSAMLDWLLEPEASRPPVRETRARVVGLRLEGEPLHADDRVWPAMHGRVTLAMQDQPIRVLIPEAMP